ncbi:MAG: glycosyltransferase family 4 protein [Candidatus Brockarchaeota archaeon]|nr:glycosyltransferase family 4 protein [Candidatus Brockarchaeota archaeon]
MKICYVAVDVAVPHFRGASTHVYELARNLIRLGHDVHLVSRRICVEQNSFEELDGIRVRRVYRGIFFSSPVSEYLQVGRQRKTGFLDLVYRAYLFTVYALYAGIVAANLVRRNNLDIIVERETSFGAGAIASMLTGRPMVLELVGPRCSILSVKRASRVLAYTESMLPESVPRSRVVIVAAAVDTDLFKPDEEQGRIVREKYGLGSSTVVGYVGTFQTWHGVEELILASKAVLEKHPEVRFLMVGPYYEQMENLARRLGVSNAYTFTGPVSYRDVPKYINAADILVAPYNPEKSELRKRYGIGSPLKVLEYMSCAKPLVTTSLKPITDVVQDEVNGLLVPPGDVEALKDALIRLIEDKDLAREMGERARRRVLGKYSWLALAKQFENVLSEAIRETYGRDKGA